MSFHLFHIRVSPQFPLNCRAIGIGDIMHGIILFSFTSLLMIPLKPGPFRHGIRLRGHRSAVRWPVGLSADGY